ncbi:unnamed protein product [Bursaphelenchus xylophilus]|uniref:(pine wood nematode) hypothetical protein n=1 Tax=Bursaphelenchus xylophilus TaxID=6326 RepID=A0A1I7S5M0_BURXY|nr:unnamed protein product [Bursaphelenchus xylophilus]CAG9124858.1 unnamed protein product [Bursaphelenchus xylophilus]
MLFARGNPYDAESLSSSSGNNAAKITFIAIAVYLVVSCILIFFYYPISFIALLIPAILFFVATLANKMESNEDLMFCTIIAVINALVKLSAIVIYITAFGLDDESSKPKKLKIRQRNEEPDYHKIFFYVLIGIELSIVLLIVFIRCNLRMCRSG